MSVSGIASSPGAAAYLTRPAQHQATVKAPQQQAPKTDTVSISKLALRLASDGDPAALEAQESSAEKTQEAAKGKV